MNKLNLNITALDRSISKDLPTSPTSAHTLSAGSVDKNAENLQKFIAILKDMDTSLEQTSKKLKEFYKELDPPTTESPKVNLFKANIEALVKPFKELSLKKDDINKLKKTLGGVSDIFKKDNSEPSIKKWAKGFSDAADSIIKKDPIGAIVNVGKTVSSMIGANKKVNKEIDQFRKDLEHTAINYSIKVIAAAKDIKSANDSIFSISATNKLSQGMTGYNAATEKLEELNEKLGSQKIQIKKKKKKTLGVTTGSKVVWGDIADSYKSILGTDKDLIDSTGNLDRAIAQSLLDSGKLSAEATKTLSEMVKVQDAADAAMEQVNNTLSSTAGSIGSDLQSALVSAFQDGTDAADTFGKSVSKMLEDIIAEQMFNTVFGEMLADLEKDMKNSYSEGGSQSMTDDIIKFYKEYDSKVDDFNKGLEEMKNQINEASGLDILPQKEKEKYSQSSTKGSFETMSQEQASSLEGRFTALHLSSVNIETDLKSLLSLQAQNNIAYTGQSNSLLQLCSTNVQSMYYLEDIKKNTNQLHQINDKLGVIQQNTSKL